jgi:phage baseplate assembly protein W
MTTYRGFSTSGNEFASVSYTDFELVKRDLMNNLNVRKGERVMNPDFGCIIWDLLFDPFTDDTHGLIVDNIMAIAETEPRVEIMEVIPSSYEQGIRVAMTLRYLPRDITESMLYDFNQEASEVLTESPTTATATGTGY